MFQKICYSIDVVRFRCLLCCAQHYQPPLILFHMLLHTSRTMKLRNICLTGTSFVYEKDTAT